MRNKYYKRLIAIAIAFAVCISMCGCISIDTDQLLNNLNDQLTESPGTTPTASVTEEPVATPVPTEIPKPSEGRAQAEAEEVFENEFEEEAAKIIDDAIWKALDAMVVSDYRGYTSDVIYSDFAEPYRNVCARYDKMLESDYKDFFEMAYNAGSNYEYFYIDYYEYGDNLTMDSLNASNVLMLYDFRLECYFEIMFDGRNEYSCYFDPENDANKEVEYGSPEFEEIKRKMNVYDAVIERVVEKMPDNLSTFQKYQYLAFVISYQCHYTEDEALSKNCHTSYAALINGDAVCEGYSKAMIELCKAAGLACEYECGQVISNGGGHMWNLITLEDGTHHVDITWSDGQYEPDNYYWFDYFCRSEDELEEINHMRTEGNEATGEDIYIW